ncbi:MAG: DUF2281 domain-containing protein [Firmicutes bacterium]|nr:DUF2281 domain-containing protein [Bacillota bacterium]
MDEINYIMREIDNLPPAILEKVADYIAYVKNRHKIGNETVEIIGIPMVQEEVLAKDWLKPEEDKAWENL